MKKERLLLSILIVFLAYFVVTPLTCSAANPVGFDDKEIRIASWGPQTGPAAPWGSIARGPALLFAMVNEAGGIHGRKIKHFLRDDQYNPSKTKLLAKELVEQVPLRWRSGIILRKTRSLLSACVRPQWD